MTWRTPRSTSLQNFIALCQPTPEISVTKILRTKKKNKQVRQLTRLAYIPTCRSQLSPHLWPWPLTSQGDPKWSLFVRHRNCCRFFTYLTSKSLTLIFDPQGHPRSKVTAPIESLLVLHVSAPGGPTSYLSPFSRYFESKFWLFTFWPWSG